MAKRPLCKHLRTKSAYISSDNPREHLYEPSQGSHYWCIHSMRGLGPDDRLVDPEECQPGRSCFEAVGRVPLVAD